MASRLSAAVFVALAMGACGGGGGGATRADPPPAAPPPAPPDPDPPVVEAPNPDYSRHLSWTGAGEAHEAGITGAGIRVGVIDSGVNSAHPALAGRVAANLVYLDPARNNLAVDDVVGHGTAVAQTIAGQPFGQWPGGIAPGATIVSARIISDEPPEDDGSGEGNEVDGALGLAPIHQDLIDRGVHIMNNSWGGLYWTNADVTAEIAAEYRPFIADNGGLVVFSTGNAGFADPSDTAALPSQPGPGGTTPAADLERGWLAVAALDADDRTQLAEYSNACGLAMHYCLAAPGTVTVTGTDDPPDAPEYWRWSGTSFSAPVVSGAAALVWEAFPYFDNDLVRQTLLGTASDLGDPGVDAVFGYGSLDVASAVRGPARLDWGDLVADFDGITSTWGNPLSGEGALVKRGSGTLVLQESTGNEGGIRVEEGELHAYLYVSGDVSVAAGAGFGIGVSVEGDLHNSGRVEQLPQEGGVGAFVGGEYFHARDAVLALDIGYSLTPLTATLEGGTLHILGVKDGYVTSDREPVLSTTLGLQGRFDGMTWASSLFLEATLGYDEFAAWLDIDRVDVSAAAKSMAGITAAGLSAAQRIETAFDGIDRANADGAGGAGDGFMAVAGAFQGIRDEATAKAALDSLSGKSHARATSLAFDTIDMGRRALSTRFGAAPGGDGIRVWKQALGRGGDTGFAGGEHALDGWLLGREHALGQTVAGFAFGEVRADDRIGWGGERSRERQAMAQLYAGRRFGDGYALAQAGSGRFDRTIERSLFAGDAGRSGIFSHYAGDYATVGVEAGRHYALAGLRLTPYVGAERTRLRSDAFEEVGGSGFGLRAEGGALRRTQTVAGVRATFDWRGATFRAHGEWQQTLAADGFDIQASFTGIDSWSPLPLADAAKSGGLFGFAIDAPLTRRSTLLLGFDQRFGPRGNERMGSVRYVVGF